MKQSAILQVFAAIAAMLPALAAAQAFPTKPIRMIVAFPPGGGTDIVARMLGSRLGVALGQQVVIENRAGADGVIGTEIAAKSPPDGHTLFLGTAGNLAINQTLYGKVTFDIARDFAAVTQVVSVDMMLTTHPSLPVRTVGALVALAKARPGELNYASTGIGGIPHLAMELFNYTAGTKIVHIPYKGGAPALVDLTGGHVPMMVQSMVQGLPIVKAGKLRAVALLSPRRAALLPDVPTVSETLPGCEATNWYGLVVPAKTPAGIHKRIYEEVVKLLRSPELKELLIAQGAEPVGSTPEQLAAFMKSETAKWARVIKQANVRSE
ncbi:MAG: tripartite tricarboxylate transporter substrate binding protein [Betaproteobacteria bacterium]|nr:tripartite tricarboxylate transporter substrate binding protein [Betaproteobacteria bacterium]